MRPAVEEPWLVCRPTQVTATISITLTCRHPTGPVCAPGRAAEGSAVCLRIELLAVRKCAFRCGVPNQNAFPNVEATGVQWGWSEHQRVPPFGVCMQRTTVVSLTLILTMLFAASCSRFGKPSDDAIATDIKARMFSDPSLKSANVNVAVKDGVVTLTGQVPDDSTRATAEQLVNSVKGVTKVDDQVVAPPPSAPPATAEATPPPPAPEPAPKPAAPRKRPVKKPEPKPEEQSQAAATSVPSPADTAQNTAPPTPAPPPPPQPITVTVPSNTVLTVRTIDSVDSKTSRAGEVIHASLDAPIVVNNHVVVPSGADAYIKLVNASSEGTFAGRNELTLQLASIVYQNRTYDVVTSDVRQSGGSRGKSSAAKIGGGAALGALIGAVAGGGKGAAIGAAVGGGAGTGLTVFKKGKDLKIPSETRLDFTLQAPFNVTYLPSRNRQPAN